MIRIIKYNYEACIRNRQIAYKIEFLDHFSPISSAICYK